MRPLDLYVFNFFACLWWCCWCFVLVVMRWRKETREEIMSELTRAKTHRQTSVQAETFFLKIVFFLFVHSILIEVWHGASERAVIYAAAATSRPTWFCFGRNSETRSKANVLVLMISRLVAESWPMKEAAPTCMFLWFRNICFAYWKLNKKWMSFQKPMFRKINTKISFSNLTSFKQSEEVRKKR